MKNTYFLSFSMEIFTIVPKLEKAFFKMSSVTACPNTYTVFPEIRYNLHYSIAISIRLKKFYKQTCTVFFKRQSSQYQRKSVKFNQFSGFLFINSSRSYRVQGHIQFKVRIWHITEEVLPKGTLWSMNNICYIRNICHIRNICYINNICYIRIRLVC